MAEIAASIIGISSFGVRLTLTLYDFGATAAAAKQSTDRIAKHISLYTNVLKLLAQSLRDDGPLITDAARDLTEDLYDQSDEKFARIHSFLPRRDINDEIGFWK